MKTQSNYWAHAGFTFLLTLLGAGALLPLIRTQPEWVHEYFNRLNGFFRGGFTLFLCTAFTWVTFKLLSPHAGHIAHLRSHPPAWLASLAAWIIVAIADVSGYLDPMGYRGSVWEWMGYGVGSLLLVAWHTGLVLELKDCWSKAEESKGPASDCQPNTNFESITWDDLELWLRTDEPAELDLLGTERVAIRISRLLENGTRSIGIVGPFGAGKTSLIRWAADLLESSGYLGRKWFICRHSCWGFETSSSSIRDMLASAIQQLNSEIDTFEIDSLPDAYRKTFSAGGDLVEIASNLVLPNADPLEQFKKLSEILGDIDGRIVFVVEDLDRNDTRGFEVQEILAFLERLKSYPNLSFILSAGLSSTRDIDFAKLCDHIEFLQIIEPRHSSGLIDRVRARCLDAGAFPHARLSDPDRNNPWHLLSGLLLRDYEELSLPHAVAALLNTPRSLRHALGRTYFAWQTLYGEIDFNHLLAINVLRFGAPECFQFLLRRWDRLSSYPSRRDSFGVNNADGIREAILADWNRTVQYVEWNPTAELLGKFRTVECLTILG